MDGKKRNTHEYAINPIPRERRLCMNGLMLHCGGHLKSREEVFAVPLPPETNSYTPLPHESLVTRIEKQLAIEGVVMRDQRLALAKDGQRLFGLMQVQLPGFTGRDYGCVLGL